MLRLVPLAVPTQWTPELLRAEGLRVILELATNPRASAALGANVRERAATFLAGYGLVAGAGRKLAEAEALQALTDNEFAEVERLVAEIRAKKESA